MNNSHDTNSSLARLGKELASATRLTQNGVLLFVTVQPGAKRSQIVGILSDRLKIAIREKAVDGAANEALVRYLAEALTLSKSNVSLLKGARSRQKTILVSASYSDLVARLTALLK